MNLQLETTFVDSLLFSEEAFENSDELEFSYASAFSEESKDSFMIKFHLKLKVNGSHILNIKYNSLFRLDSEITEEFKHSPFLDINAPAIAFPYLRAFISNFLLSSGFEPIILPSINFTKLKENKKNHI